MSEQAIVAEKPKKVRKPRVYRNRMGPSPLPKELKVIKFSMSLPPDDYAYLEKIRDDRKLFWLSKAFVAIIEEHRASHEKKK